MKEPHAAVPVQKVLPLGFVPSPFLGQVAMENPDGFFRALKARGQKLWLTCRNEH